MRKVFSYKARIITIIGSVATAILTIILITASMISTANAATAEDTFLKKALANALKTCYEDTYMKNGKDENDPITGSDFAAWGISWLMTSEGESSRIIYVPTKVGNSLNDPVVTCKEVFNGASRTSGLFGGRSEGSMSGLLSLYSKSANDITNFGYQLVNKESSTGARKGCLALKYRAQEGTGSRPYTTNEVCFKLTSENNLDVGSYSDVTYGEAGDNGPVSLSYNSGMMSLNLYMPEAASVYGTSHEIGWVKNGTSWDEFCSSIKSVLQNGYEYDGFNPLTNAWRYASSKSIERIPLGYTYEDLPEDSVNTEFYESYEKMARAKYKALEFITGASSFADVRFTEQEEYDLLEAYYLNHLGVGGVYKADCFTDRDAAKAASGYAHRESNGTWCAILGVENIDETYNIVNTSRDGLTPVQFSEVMQLLTNWDFQFTDESNAGIVDNVPGEVDGDATTCLNSASSLGWILCPVLQIIGTTVEGFYQNIEEDWLPIEANLLSTRNNTAIYDGWKVFRNFANIFFVIILVIIIFSQITGYGVTNYGIKKMLPSLIVMAILVNISFFICQVVVDGTNIIGAGIDGVLTWIGNSVTAHSANSSTGSELLKGAIAVIFSGAGIALAGLGALNALATNPGLLVPILIFGLGLIVSLFFFLAILAIRKAGVFLLVLLSPLAIICYALPNTKNLFDKWKRMFASLLLVYPICQALVGAGHMMSKIMLSQAGDEGSFMFSVVAVIISFAPIFFIPAIIRNSMAAMGNLGTKLSQLGSRVRARTTGALSASDTAKRLQVAGSNLGATKGRELVGRVNNRLRNARGVGKAISKLEDSAAGKLISQQNARRAAQAKVAYRKMLLDDAPAANIAENMDAESIRNDLAAQEYKYQQELIDNASTNMLVGNESYLDGNGLQTINTSEMLKGGSMDRALRHFWNAYNQTKDEKMAVRARAVAQLMLDKGGDKGRTTLMSAMREMGFDANGNATPSSSFGMLSRFIGRNDKWMAGIKASDPGSFNMIGDAMSDKGIQKGLYQYNTMGANKVATSTVQNLSDNFFDSIKAAAHGVYDVNSSNFDQEAYKNLQSLSSTFEQTMADPRTASTIKPEMLDFMNEVTKTAYEARQNEWLKKNAGKTKTDYKKQYGPYASLEPGHELKVTHKKAAMPQGWKRIKNSSGQEIWVDANFNPLSTAQIKQAEAIESQNIDADIKNSLN